MRQNMYETVKIYVLQIFLLHSREYSFQEVLQTNIESDLDQIYHNEDIKPVVEVVYEESHKVADYEEECQFKPEPKAIQDEDHDDFNELQNFLTEVWEDEQADPNMNKNTEIAIQQDAIKINTEVYPLNQSTEDINIINQINSRKLIVSLERKT